MIYFVAAYVTISCVQCVRLARRYSFTPWLYPLIVLFGFAWPGALIGAAVGRVMDWIEK